MYSPTKADQLAALSKAERIGEDVFKYVRGLLTYEESLNLVKMVVTKTEAAILEEMRHPPAESPESKDDDNV